MTIQIEVTSSESRVSVLPGTDELVRRFLRLMQAGCTGRETIDALLPVVWPHPPERARISGRMSDGTNVDYSIAYSDHRLSRLASE